MMSFRNERRKENPKTHPLESESGAPRVCLPFSDGAIPPRFYSLTKYNARPSSNSSFAPFARSNSWPRPASIR